MNMFPGVSVVIPVFNRKTCLKKALISTLEQSKHVSEIIVVDDGSTDGSSDMLKQEFPQIKLVVNQNNKGVSAARNAGIVQSRSEWIAFLDSDDEWLPSKIEQQMDYLASNPEMKVCHTEEVWVRNGRRVNQMNKHQKSGGWIYQQCLPQCAMSPSSILIHRSVFDDVGMFDESLPACEDYDLWLRICSRYPVLYKDEPLIVKYGGHDDQLSRKYWGMDRFRIKALTKILDENILGDEDKLATRSMLKHKIDIFNKGAAKRGNHSEIERLLQLKEAYCQ